MDDAIHFTDLTQPGFRRRRAGKGWVFLEPEGTTVTCPDTRSRLLAVGLPPAYRETWYNTDPDGHIQAIGVDARGRRQYRYHPHFRAHQEEEKFDHLAQFGRALPAIRARTDAALAKGGLDRDHVIAAVVRLLDLGQLRVGNERYAHENRSYGATTLRNRHVAVEGHRVRLRFRAKGGVDRRLTLTDRALARVVRRCQELPGQHLLSWEDADGVVRPVRSQDVNAWLRESGGPGLSSKAFRTWWASTIALEQLALKPGTTLKEMLAIVCDRLGNTPAVARKSYVHPAVIEVALGNRPLPVRGRGPRTLTTPERRLISLLLADAETPAAVKADALPA